MLTYVRAKQSDRWIRQQHQRIGGVSLPSEFPYVEWLRNRERVHRDHVPGVRRMSDPYRAELRDEQHRSSVASGHPVPALRFRRRTIGADQSGGWAGSVVDHWQRLIDDFGFH
jgi:hypothetical protein